jgi:hypothetical protein
VLVVGDHGVGKTGFTMTYCVQSVANEHLPLYCGEFEGTVTTGGECKTSREALTQGPQWCIVCSRTSAYIKLCINSGQGQLLTSELLWQITRSSR